MREHCSIDTDGFGCMLATVLLPNGDSTIIYECDLKHIQKDLSDQIDWFKFCPDCGTQLAKLLEKS